MTVSCNYWSCFHDRWLFWLHVFNDHCVRIIAGLTHAMQINTLSARLKTILFRREHIQGSKQNVKGEAQPLCILYVHLINQMCVFQKDSADVIVECFSDGPRQRTAQRKQEQKSVRMSNWWKISACIICIYLTRHVSKEHILVDNDGLGTVG